MTECQKLIAYKQTVQAAKNKLKQMSGISILEILEQNENPGLNEMFSAYTTTFGNDIEPYSKLSYPSPAETFYSWLIGTMELKENDEYYFYCGIWCRIKLLDLRLAIPSLWLHNGNTKGFLLAETDSSRMLEAGFDSRDENYYLIDIWNYSEQRNY